MISVRKHHNFYRLSEILSKASDAKIDDHRWTMDYFDGFTTILGTWTIYYGPWAVEMKSMESERRFEEVKLDKIVPEKYASRANYNF